MYKKKELKGKQKTGQFSLWLISKHEKKKEKKCRLLAFVYKTFLSLNSKTSSVFLKVTFNLNPLHQNLLNHSNNRKISRSLKIT